MKTLILLILALPIWAQQITLIIPYRAAVATYITGNATPMGVTFGEPAIEAASATPRRMAFSYTFTETDETTGLMRDADLTWLAKRLLTIAKAQNICLAGDTNAQCLVKIKEYVTIRRSGGLPANWVYPVTP